MRLFALLSLGLAQCPLARCVFNGVGCDEEMVACPWLPCPCCLRKLVAARAVGSPRELLSSLRAFFARHSAPAHEGGRARFADDIALVDERLRRLDEYEGRSGVRSSISC